MTYANRLLSVPVALAFASLIVGSAAEKGAAQTVFVDQGKAWSDSQRQEFYTQDQGSRIMPLAWMRALTLPDGLDFLHDSLTRYGYLANPHGSEPDVPVGFTIAPYDADDFGGVQSIGMTCSACHTRQIDVNGTAYRIDGGPAIVDFQSFLKDLDDAVGAVLATAAGFDSFADKVIAPPITDEKKQALKIAVETWHLRFHTLMDRSLPDPAWGPSRLDAVSMIFNRLAGLDIGEPPTYLIPGNIKIADAPTRYPFLWNAARQDKTQWPGFADNGNDILGLARNLGEVYGVFAVFHPVKQDGFFELNRNYIKNNSANFSGLGTLEDLIWKIGPPKWPWQLDSGLAARGQKVFNRGTDEGGCVECHGIKTGAFRSPFHRTWATPVLDVGTDTRECSILTRSVATGVMEGANIPLLTGKIGATDTAFNVLKTTVLGAIIQNALSFRTTDAAALTASTAPAVPPEFDHLRGAFRTPAPLDANFTASLNRSGCHYESRVLRGIWAAAPYLHNGSVPTLVELLKPAAERVAAFKLGPNYDIEAVGLAAAQTKFDFTLNTTDCSELDSGNSRCGHEFGTSLSPDDRKALLEYLKSL